MIGRVLAWSRVHLSRGGLLYLCALVLASSLLLGGGTRAGFLSDAVLQFSAIPLLSVAFWYVLEVPLSKQARWALFLSLAMLLVPIIQLIPLPPALWTWLPNREPSAETLTLLGRGLTWMPVSVSPHATWLSALSLLPAVAIFVGTLLLSYRERRLLSLVVLSVGVLSVFIGLVQIAQGPSSPLRFFEFTNVTEAVGFFANRNHFAALLYSLTLFAAAWAVETAAATQAATDRKIYDTASIVMFVGSFTVLVVLVAAQAMARSRAGLGLTIVVLFGAFALAISDRRGTSRFTPTKLLLSAVAVAGMFAVQFALYRILERFAFDPLEDARIPFARNTIEAAIAYLPFGSGLGTFIPVYAMFEKPQDAMINAYANHAHNDILELWLETGIFGIGLIGLFAIWLVPRSVEIWRRALPHGAREIDTSLARAATVVIALLIAHSFVDYPMRTGAMMAVMAFACALLICPPVGTESAATLHEAREDAGRSRDTRRLAPVSPTAGQVKTASEAPSPHAAEWTAAEIEWPEAWRQPTPQGSISNKGNRSGSIKPSGNEST